MKKERSIYIKKQPRAKLLSDRGTQARKSNQYSRTGPFCSKRGEGGWIEGKRFCCWVD